MTEELLRRFWAKVEKNGPNDCWIWLGGITYDGYGMASAGNGRQVAAHRFSWELHNGPAPADACILHTCDTPYCVNPAHMRLGSPADNVRDTIERGRWLFFKRHGLSRWECIRRDHAQLCASSLVAHALNDIGAAIRVRRRLVGMSQEQLGRIMGVHSTTLCRIETGKRSVSPYELERIKATLHWTTDLNEFQEGLVQEDST
jgi:DNA-binding transcriptional regulator YiaG